MRNLHFMVLYRSQRIHPITGWLYFVGDRCFANAQHDVEKRVFEGSIVSWFVLQMERWFADAHHDVINRSFRQSAATEESLHFRKDTPIGHKESTELPIEYISWVTEDSLTLTVTETLGNGFLIVGWFVLHMERWLADVQHDV